MLPLLTSCSDAAKSLQQVTGQMGEVDSLG